ncbi:MAG: flagellar hook-associated protein FlgK [Acidobacteria bacterium]|nr:flagellar hook-associated protein FlgK [Acidobacteriota bacterium]
MSNLFASLQTASRALLAFQDAVTVSQNNIQNAATPGYVKQRAGFQADPFAPENGAYGGVGMGPLESFRSQHAERQVQRQVQSLGTYDAGLSVLKSLEGEFSADDGSGIAAGITALMSAFSAWSARPNDAASRQQVIAGADALSASIRSVAAGVVGQGRQVDEQIRETIAGINEIAQRISAYNRARRSTGQADPGLDAQLHADLERLSEFADFNTVYQPDGTVTVFLGGETPLVLGERAHPISAEFPAVRILDESGADISGQIHGGRLAGLLGVRNETIGGLIGRGSEMGSLNRLARDIADQVNAAMAPGPPLFSYEASRPAAIALSLSVAAGITPEALVAGNPAGGASNGIASRLAQLAESFSGKYGSIAADLGRQVNRAQEGRNRASEGAAQASALRSELSGVSLDEEAARLVELQRAYEAAAKTVGVLDELTQTVLGLLR